MSDLLHFTPVRAVDLNSVQSPSARAYFYRSGTATAATVYADAAGTVPHPSPLIANAQGVFPAVFTTASYAIKVDVKNTAGVSLTGFPMDPVIKVPAGVTGATSVAFDPTLSVPYTNVQTALAAVGLSAKESEDLLAGGAKNFDGSVADYYSTHKYDIVGGVLRQDPADRTKWLFLNDTAHAPVGFDPDPAMLASDGTTPLHPRAAGNTLLLFFKNATDARRLDVNALGYYDRVVSCNAWTDETLTKDWGISVGAKVTRSGLVIYGSMHKSRHGRIYWDGTAWQASEDAYHPTGTVTTSYDSGTGVLTVNHEFLPGQILDLEEDTRGGLTPSPHDVKRYDVESAGTQFRVVFRDYVTGAVITGAPDTSMSFRWTKSYDGPVNFDGTFGWDVIPWDTGDAGNIWIFGAMRRS